MKREAINPKRKSRFPQPLYVGLPGLHYAHRFRDAPCKFELLKTRASGFSFLLNSSANIIEASREGREPTRMRVNLAALMSRATSPYVFASIR